MDVLHQLHQLLAQLGVALFLCGLYLLALIQDVETLQLKPMQLPVGGGDLLEGLQHLGHELGFHGGEREIDLLFIGVIVGLPAVRLAFAIRLTLAVRLALAVRFSPGRPPRRRLRRLLGLIGVLLALGVFLAVFLVQGVDPGGRIMGQGAVGAGAVGGLEVDDVAEQHLAFQQGVVPADDGADG